jgi:hypothetical protein
MADNKQRRDIEALIRAKLIELIRLSCEHNIRIERLMHEALELSDPEEGMCR